MNYNWNWHIFFEPNPTGAGNYLDMLVSGLLLTIKTALLAWVIALIFAPFLSALIYVIARGRGMAERQAGEVRKAQAATDSYIQEVAGRSNPAEQITTAKSLLDEGTITQTEFDRLKASALA